MEFNYPQFFLKKHFLYCLQFRLNLRKTIFSKEALINGKLNNYNFQVVADQCTRSVLNLLNFRHLLKIS
jgi:hypothetical protein